MQGYIIRYKQYHRSDNMFHYTVKTNESIDDAIDTLESELKTASFGVLWKFDIKETLENKGFDFDQSYRVLEVCNPKEDKDILEKNSLVGYFLPCKIVVYEENDFTMIGLPRLTQLIFIVKDEQLKVTAKNNEDRLIKCIDASVK